MTYLTKPGSPQEVLNELTHYGVLGMKWGVRKDRPCAGSRKPSYSIDKEGVLKDRKPWSTKKKVLVGTAAVVGLAAAVVSTKVGIDFARAAKQYTHLLNGEGHINPLTFEATSSLRSRYADGSDVDFVVRKGHEFIRRSHVLETKIDTRAYASASAARAKQYGSYDFGNNVMSMFTKKDIKVASYKQGVDTLLENNTKRQLVKTLNREGLGRRLYQDLVMKPVDVANLSYFNMHSRNFDKDSDPRVVQYLETMMAKGYSAVKDQIDGGDAFVLFDNAAFDIVKKTI